MKSILLPLMLILILSVSVWGEDAFIPDETSSPTLGSDVTFVDSKSTSGTLPQYNAERVVDLFQAGDFEELESIGDFLVTEDVVTSGGQFALEIFYSGFEKAISSEDQDSVSEALDLLEEWRKEFPDSLHPIIIIARVFRLRAQHALERNPGNAQKGHSKYIDYLDAADEFLRDIELNREIDNPAYYVEWIEIIRRKNNSLAFVIGNLQKGIQINQNYLPLYYSAANALVELPNGYREAEQVARMAMTGAQLEDSHVYYTQVAISLLGRFRPEEILGYVGFDWNILREGLKDLINRYEDDNFYRQVMARFAAAMNDPEAAKEAFDGTGDEADTRIWSSQSEYDAAMEWAQGNSANPVAAIGIVNLPQRNLEEARLALAGVIIAAAVVAILFLLPMFYLLWVILRMRRT